MKIYAFLMRQKQLATMGFVALWRNWQTQQTQNLPGFTPRLGSTPSSATIIGPHRDMRRGKYGNLGPVGNVQSISYGACAS